MALPHGAPLNDLSVAELRKLVTALVGELDQLRAETLALRAQNQALKNEIARLKGLPPRPPKLAPSGMERAGEAGAHSSAKTGGRKRGRGSTLERLTLTQEVVLRAEAPVGSRFKGYEDVLVQDLHPAARVIRCRRERWLTPAGETVLAALPAGIVGGFGPELRRFVLAGHIQGQVTSERLTALLNGIGVAISKRQVVRLLSAKLEAFSAEDCEVLRAGLAGARWITVDDTAARHADREGYTTQIGDARFTAFRSVEAASGLPVSASGRSHGLCRQCRGAGLHAGASPRERRDRQACGS
jgi:hypothetical protein